MINKINIKSWVMFVILAVFSVLSYAQTPDTDLSAHEPTIIPTGATFEWHISDDPTSDLVDEPGAVAPGLYYGFYNFGDGCFSQGSPIRIITNECPEITANLNDVVDAAPAGAELSFHSELPVNDDNAISGTEITQAGEGTYYAALKTVINGSNCYSNASPIVMVLTDCAPPNSTVAYDDINNTNIDTPVSGNVLTNDEDEEGDDQTVTSNTDPSNGSVVVNADGTYVYTPNPGYSGEDTFTYSICDNGTPVACDDAVVVITILPLDPINNNPPVANNDISTTEEGEPVDIVIISNDFDTDGDDITVTPGSISEPENGTAVLNPDGTVTYTPDPEFIGEDTFTYQICDNGTPVLCDEATVTVTILPEDEENDTVANDDAYNGDQDTPITANVLDNDTDEEGDDQTVNTTPVVDPANGTVVLNEDGTFVYTPNPGYSGPDSFVYSLCDDGTPVACDEATAVLTINPVNTTYAYDDINNTNIDTPVSGNVLTNDEDEEGDDQTVTSNTDPSNGSVVVNADGTYVYTPNPGYSGEDTFTYSICDNGTPVACDDAVVVITILPLDPINNNPPVANNDISTTEEGEPVDIVIISNDFDTDGDDITVTPGSISEPENGTAVLNPDGTVTYTPDPEFIGEDTFTYQICDNGTPVLCDEATVTVTILPEDEENDTVANDDAYNGDQDTPITANVLDNDTDEEGDDQTVNTTPVVDPANGTVVLNEDGTFVYTPNPGYSGPDSFVYSLCDDGTPVACDEATAVLTINPVNTTYAYDDINNTNIDTPVSGNVLTNDEDEEGDDQTVTSNTDPSNGSVVVNADGTYVYTPNPGYSGEDTFTYSICDNGTPVACDDAVVVITILPLDPINNNPPVANNDISTTEEGEPVDIVIISNDFDTDGDDITVTPGSISEPENGTAVLNPDGTVTYTPDPEFIGEDTFTYQICDNGTPVLCDEATVTVTILPEDEENDTVANDDAYNGDQDTPITANVLDNDTDEEGDDQTVNTTPVVDPANGTVVLNEDGTFVYTPNLGYSGPDSFVYSLCDDGTPVACDEATAVLTINPCSADSDCYVFPEDLTLECGVDYNDLSITGTAVDNCNANNAATYSDDVSGDSCELTVTRTWTIIDACGNTLTGVQTLSILDTTPPVLVGIPENGTFNSEEEISDAIVQGIDNCDDDVVVALSSETIYLDCGFQLIRTWVATDNCGNESSVSQVTVVIDPANSDPAGDCDGDGVTNGDELNPPNGEEPTNPLDPCDFIVSDMTLAPSSAFLADDCDGDGVTNGDELTPPNGEEATDPQDPCDYIPSDITLTVTAGVVCNTTDAIDDSYTALQDTPFTSNVLDNDVDEEGDNQTVNTTPVEDPSNGTVVLNEDGTFTYTPNPGFVGTDSFVYSLCDDGFPQACDEATVVLTIDELDPCDIDENNPASLALDCDGDGVTNGDELNPPNGEEPTNPLDPCDFIASDMTLAPSSAFLADDCDGDGVTNGDELNPPNGEEPTNPLDPCDFIVSDMTLAASSAFLADDCDGDGVTNGDELTPPNGEEATDPQDPCDYIPSDITLTVTAGVVCNTTDAIDDSYTALQDTPFTSNVLDNDVDEEGDNQTVNTTPVEDPSNGTVVLNEDGTFTYTPNPGFVGTDSFVYSLCDDGFPQACDEATVVLTIDELDPCDIDENNPASLALDCDGDGVTNGDELNPPNGEEPTNPLDPCDFIASDMTLAPSSAFLADDCDGDGVTNGDELTPPNGEEPTNPLDPCDFIASDMTLAPSSAFLADDCDGDGVTNGDELNPPNGEEPTNPLDPCDFIVSDMTLAASSAFLADDCDGDGVTNGDELTPPNGEEATDPQDPCDYIPSDITLTVTAGVVCNTTDAIDDSYTALQDTPFTSNVLDNDVDEEGDNQTVNTTPVEDPSNGTVVLNEDGTFTYTPNPGFVGTDSFVYSLCDDGFPQACDEATVVLTIDELDPCDIDENNPASLALDCDGDGVTNGDELNPPNGEEPTNPLDPCDFIASDMTLAPSSAFLADDCDGDGVTNGDELTPPNGEEPTNPLDPCDFIASDMTLAPSSAFLADDCDGDGVTNGDELTPPNGEEPTNPLDPCDFIASDMTLAPSSAFLADDCDGDGVTNGDELTPPNGEEATDPQDPCDYIPSDITLTVTAGVVCNTTDAIDDSYTALQDTPFTSNVLDNDVDEEGDNQTVNTTPVEDPSNGTVVLNEDGTFTYTPNPGFVGTDSFVYSLCDDGFPQACDEATVVLTIEELDPCDIDENNPASLALDCDGDGVTNGDELNPPNGEEPTNPLDPCDFIASDMTLAPSSAFLADDCDGDGVTNGDELTPPNGEEATDPQDPCDYIPSDITLTVTAGVVCNTTDAIDDSYTALQDTPFTSNVLDNDVDEEGDNQTVNTTPVEDPSNGTVVLNEDGTFTYTPNPGFVGTDSFVYSLCDDGFPQACDEATVVLTIEELDPCDIDETNPASLALDCDGDGVTNGDELNPPNGEEPTNPLDPCDFIASDMTLAPSSAFLADDCDGDGVTNGDELTPPNGEEATDPQDPCDYIPSDITLTVTAGVVCNTTDAIDDSYTALQDTPFTSNVLDNDVDEEGDNQTVNTTPVEDPSNGTVVLNEDGTFTYTPNPGFVGTDSFVYSLCDDGFPQACDEATVVLTIEELDPCDIDETNPASLALDCDGDGVTNGDELNPPNGEEPTNPLDPCDFIASDMTLAPSSAFLADDCDGDGVTNGDELTPPNGEEPTNPLDPCDFIVSDMTLAPSSAFLADDCDGDGVTNGDELTPPNGEEATDPQDPCDYIPSDITLTVTAGVVCNTTDAIDDSYTALQDTPFTSNVLDNDVDEEGDNQTVNTTPVEDPSNGTVVLNEDGTFTYTPNPGFVGTDSFVYSLCDDGFPQACDEATVVLTIDELDPCDIDENNPASLALDCDGDGVTNGDELNPPNGEEPTNPLDPCDFIASDMTLAPSSAFLADDCDGDGVTNGDELTPPNGEEATDPQDPCDYIPSDITLTVTAGVVCNTTDAIDDSYTALQDTPFTSNVLDNDVDEEGDNQTVNTTPVEDPSNGTVVLNEDGTFTYTPNPGFVGTDSFVYSLCDDGFPQACDEATVVLTIEELDPCDIDENNPASLALDCDGDGVTNGDELNPPNGEEPTNPLDPCDFLVSDITLAPSAAFLADDCDGDGVTNGDELTPPNGEEATDPQDPCDYIPSDITLTVTAGVVCNTTDAIDDSYTALQDTPFTSNVLDNDVDEEGDNQTVNTTPVEDPSNGTVVLNEDGTFTYTPNPGFVGTDSFVYSLCDDGFPQACDEATVVLTIDELAPCDIDENNPASLALDCDGDGVTNGDELNPPNGEEPTNPLDPCDFLVSDITLAPSAAFLADDCDGDGVTNGDELTPPNGEEATDPQDPCDYIPSDITLTVTAGVVCNTTDAIDDSYTALQDTPFTSNVLDNDVDEEGDNQTVNTTPVEDPSNGTVVLNEDGTFTYTPNSGFVGTDSFVYSLCDDGFPQACDEATVVLTIDELDPCDIDENNPASLALDCDGDGVTNGDELNPPNGEEPTNPLDPCDFIVSDITLAPSAAFLADDCDGDGVTNGDELTPPNGEEATDPQDPCDYIPSDITLDVTAGVVCNDTDAVDDFYTLTEDTPFTGNVLDNDVDEEGDNQTVNTTPVEDPSNGTVVLNEDGTFTYTPNPGFVGTDSFVYSLCDDGFPQACDEATVVLAVTECEADSNCYAFPADITVECDVDVTDLSVTGVALDNCNSDNNASYSDAVSNSDCDVVITRTWSLTDACGYTMTQVQSITITDTTAPVINCPASVFAQCDSNIDLLIDDVTATDNCDDDVELTYVDYTSENGCMQFINRVWTAADACGNTSTHMQEITIMDSQAPIIFCEASINAECGSDIVLEDATAADNCDDDVELTYVDTPFTLNACESGFTRVWTAIDDCGNTSTFEQVVTFIDTSAPVISCPADFSYNLGDEPELIEAQAYDACESSVSLTYSDDSTPLGCSGQTIVRTWTAMDDCGNTSTCEQIITVFDNEAPVLINVPADLSLTSCDLIPSVADVTASDNSGDAVITFSEETSENTCPITIVRTWTAEDCTGNMTSANQVILVYDIEVPEFNSYPVEVYLDCEEFDSYMLEATDGCDADVEVTYTDLEFSGGCFGIVQRTWIATDDCGNQSQPVIQFIHRTDDETPELFNVPASITLECGDDIPEPSNDVYGTDNCDSDVNIIFTEEQSGTFCPYVITRTWQAEDACGNLSDIGTQTITVEVETPEFVTVFAYPNPANDQFTVQFSLPADKQVNASIVDAFGRTVSSVYDGQAEKQTLYEFQISSDGWESGMYILRLIVGEEVYHHKIVIN